MDGETQTSGGQPEDKRRPEMGKSTQVADNDNGDDTSTPDATSLDTGSKEGKRGPHQIYGGMRS